MLIESSNRNFYDGKLLCNNNNKQALQQAITNFVLKEFQEKTTITYFST